LIDTNLGAHLAELKMAEPNPGPGRAARRVGVVVGLPGPYPPLTWDARYAMSTVPMLTAKCPKALAAGTVIGHGPYALASCPDGTGVRRIHLFETYAARSRVLREWEGRGPNDYTQCSNWTTCRGMHELFEVVDNRGSEVQTKT